LPRDSSGDSITGVLEAGSLREVLVTWPGYDAAGAATGRRLTGAGLSLRLAPKLGRRTPRELHRLLDGAGAAIVSTDPFDAGVLGRARDLRVIARVGVGTDSIDVEAATRLGIAVCTTPGTNAATTADHAVALMLAALRRVPEHDRAIRDGGWPRGSEQTPWELTGLTVGLVGFGTIGRLVAARLRGFAVRLLVADPAIEANGDGIELVDLDTLLAGSDVVSLHLPLSGETARIIDARRLGAMRPSALLVNTARGGLVDEDALVDALEARRLRAAALDVFAEEPPASARLRALPNVVFTPHLGGVSERSVAEMTAQATDAVLAVLGGRVPEGLVNPAALGRTGARR
jgi:phosphoglycerate dehydrogenase-like enzyme